jgi:UDP-N-acetylmuramate dehydrogenase
VAIRIEEHVPLAPRTTFELGGAARFYAEAADEAAVLEAVAWAGARGVPALILGGGSNLVVPDAGVEALVVRMAARGLSFRPEGDHVLCEAAAGEPWDEVVAAAVARGLAGLECLSGIPGLCGATPIQNVGAYGQEVADVIRSVRVFDRRAGQVRELLPAACGFAYRDSAFRRDAGGHVVLGVTFALRPGGAPTLRYAELAAALADRPAPTLAEARAAVLALRRGKSMVIDPVDPNRRSAGSFFTNPVVTPAVADAVVDRAVAAGAARAPAEVPRYPAPGGQAKLAAGWLIERAGITKGLRRGPVGISTRHALALVHHGGGTTAALLELARHVRATVEERFGVRLVPEPVILGASAADPLVLADAGAVAG